MVEELKKPNHQNKKEDVRLGYQVATDLWAYEGQLLWSKFNAMLVANSIVLATIGLGISASSKLAIFTKGMPLAGLAFCLLWFLVTKRGFDNYIYWVLSARELEEQYLSDAVKTVSRGGDLADGKKVHFKINNQTKEYQMSFLGSFKVRQSSYLVIALFAAMYILILAI